MEIDLMMPSPPSEFIFDSACTSPFITAPSTPSFFTTPILFEDDFDFDFDFSATLHRPFISHADDLFYDGQIKPLKPTSYSAPESPKPQTKISIEALKQSTQDNRGNQGSRANKAEGRTRSLSPFRVSDILSENDSDLPKLKKEKQSTLFSFPKSAWKKYKNLKLKDFLFRSASESRKYEIRRDKIQKELQEDVKSSSFRSTESFGSGSGSGLRRKSSLSAHYAVNRAVQEEMKKKTALPYKHGLMGMGCLGLEPAVNDLARSIGSSRS